MNVNDKNYTKVNKLICMHIIEALVKKKYTVGKPITVTQKEVNEVKQLITNYELHETKYKDEEQEKVNCEIKNTVQSIMDKWDKQIDEEQKIVYYVPNVDKFIANFYSICENRDKNEDDEFVLLIDEKIILSLTARLIQEDTKDSDGVDFVIPKSVSPLDD